MTAAIASDPALELDRTPDLVELAGAARDAGHDVMLFERAVPDAVSIAAVGRRFEIVSTPEGADLQDGGGPVLGSAPDSNRLTAPGRLWARLAAASAVRHT